MPGEAYQLAVTRSARKELIELPPKVSEQVERAIERLISAFAAGQRPHDMRPIKGRLETYRVDTGEYRVLFSVDDRTRTIKIFRVRHRKHAYRNL